MTQFGEGLMCVCSPKVEVVHRSLLVSHVDVVGKEVDRRRRPTLKDFMERWETVASVVLLQSVLGFRHVDSRHSKPSPRCVATYPAMLRVECKIL